MMMSKLRGMQQMGFCRQLMTGLALTAIFAVGSIGSAQAQQGTLETIKARGKLIVGTRFDTPGVNQLNPVTGVVEGFDAEIAYAIAKRIGLGLDKVEFVEVISANRETAIEQGLVDIVLSGYAITKKRRDVVGQAGPYIEAYIGFFINQDDVARFNTIADIKDAKVCSTPTSSMVPIIKENGGIVIPIDDNSACSQQVINKLVDGKMGHDLTNVGFLDKFPGMVISHIPPIATEGWGVGFRKGDEEFCTFLKQTLADTGKTGEWMAAWNKIFKPLKARDRQIPQVDEKCWN